MSLSDVRTPAKSRVLNQRKAGAAYRESCPRLAAMPLRRRSIRANGSLPGTAVCGGKKRWKSAVVSTVEPLLSACTRWVSR
jgi:hypothetical protein